eukprot:tig00000663_g2984.t1
MSAMEVDAGAAKDAGPKGGFKGRKPEIDREKVCPLLLRVFPVSGKHHRVEEYANRNSLPADELQIYTWMDATLRELTDLIKEVNETARRRDAELSFAFVYPDRSGKNVLREVGLTHATRKGQDDFKTLADLHFQIGDYLDVAVIVREVREGPRDGPRDPRDPRDARDFREGNRNWRGDRDAPRGPPPPRRPF